MGYIFSSYSDALCMSSLERLDDRRDMITQKVFRQIKDPKHPVHNILPPVSVTQSNDLATYLPVSVPFCKNTRYGRDFVPYCISKFLFVWAVLTFS